MSGNPVKIRQSKDQLPVYPGISENEHWQHLKVMNHTKVFNLSEM